MGSRSLETKIDRIVRWLTRYKKKANCRGVVIGVSGGKDSTTVAMLCKLVWGDNVRAILMPNGVQEDLQDSIDIVEKLRMSYQIVDIEWIYQNVLGAIKGIPFHEESSLRQINSLQVSPKAETNIPPRIRMTVLYAIAQTLGYRVIGTGNASEAYVGWCTKWGDCACDFNPIAHLTCTEVVEVGKYLAKKFGLDEKFITKPPADGLSGKSDEDNFGFTYEILDGYIRGEKIPDQETVEKIERMHESTAHKRAMPVTVE